MSAKATAWAWDQDLPANEKITLLALADQARDDGAVQLPQSEVVAMTGASTRTVRTNVGKLEDRVLLRRHPRHEHGARIPDVIKLATDGDLALPADFAGGSSPAGFAGGDLQAEGKSRPTGESRRAHQSSSQTSSSLNGGEGTARQDSPVLAGVDVPEEMLADAAGLLRQKVKVAGRLVTEEEMAKASAALAEFNRQGESGFGLGGAYTSIVGRIRERPSYDAAALVRLVESAWRVRWWERNGKKGRRASPAVIFGNAGCFENVVQDAIDERAGRDRPATTGRFERTKSREEML